MRIAVVWIPDFPVQALRRSVPELAEAPLAVAAGPAPRDALVAVAAEAVALGVRPGMTAAQARQVAPAVLLRPASASAAAAADEALADVAGGFSPHLMRRRPGEIALDVGGLLPRFGSERSGGGSTPPERGGRGGTGAPGGGRERRGPPREGWIAHELLRACRRVGLEARVGVASSAGVARIAARTGAAADAAAGGDAAVVRDGGERAFMAPRPLALLEPPPEAAATLARWGLATAGELAGLARREVALRLGPAGVPLHRLACGEPAEAFIPDPARAALREGVDLDDAVGSLEPFLFVTSGLLARLAQRLELRGEGFAGVLLELRLEGGGRRELQLSLTAPTRDVPAVLALARLQLEAHPPGAPVEGVSALITPGRVRLAQGSLFGPALPAPGKLSTTLARLAALVGPESVGAPALPDTHRPGAWALASFVLNDRGSWIVDRGSCRPPGTPLVLTGDCGDGGSSAVGREPSSSSAESVPRTTNHDPQSTAVPVLRAFRPPRDARVDAVDGRPVVVWVEALGGIVVACGGPYRFTGEWWGGEPFSRDDFDVATTDGSLLRLHFDRLARRWFADGVYD